MATLQIRTSAPMPTPSRGEASLAACRSQAALETTRNMFMHDNQILLSGDRSDVFAKIALVEAVIKDQFPRQLLAPYLGAEKSFASK